MRTLYALAAALALAAATGCSDGLPSEPSGPRYEPQWPQPKWPKADIPMPKMPTFTQPTFTLPTFPFPSFSRESQP